MRYLFFLLVLTTVSFAQISNVRQTIENGRIVITYDLHGKESNVYDISLTTRDAQGNIIIPAAVAGNTGVSAGSNRIIWWEPQLEGYGVAGWTVTLSATKSYYSSKLGITWVLVQGGSNGDFEIASTEVTFDQFDAFCDETGYKKPKANFGRGKQPVINVNVADAQAFCKWLGEKNGTTIRLPEENEWEFAAKGGKKSNGYTYSGSNSVEDVAWYSSNSGSKAHEVATKKANELGIYDMSGNVWEWCGTSGAIRGGSWSFDGGSCPVSYRYDFNPGNRLDSYGFRILQKK